ncbi:MAG TPA: histidine kinase dimerization/phosphoacceptor domain-containing protein [Candidatus Dormibacteraeota bacterium]|nr:histidine kinase dimerization/phosphoacceptor domain-containing protein [Candidatus Dormibacteraeota bacterium]
MPRVFRYGIAATAGIWFVLDNIDGFPYRSPLSRALGISTGVVVLGAICFIWVLHSSGLLRARLAVNALLGAVASAALLLQPGNGMGQVAALAAVIVASGTGLLGVPLAIGVAGFYVAAMARSVHAVSPTLTAGVGGGAVLGVLAAYFLPMWSRYLWSIRAEAAGTRERQRLAREMHDVLAHTLSGLAVQLEATRLLAERRSEDPAVIEAVADTARTASSRPAGRCRLCAATGCPGSGSWIAWCASSRSATGSPAGCRSRAPRSRSGPTPSWRCTARPRRP